ncbi:TPA: restriction endonuclease subunit S, partial [Escherichia coli]|nr:restriction endonuclease subunit S [Escherichia coli]
IAINTGINQTLEQMSQTLFKSWFVDFDPVVDNALDAGNPIPEALQSRAELRQKVRNSTDFKPLPAEIRSLFPSEFEETELGWVPKGWTL